MSFDESMRRIAHWLDQEEEALEYAPDGAPPVLPTESIWDCASALVAWRYPDGIASAVFPLSEMMAPPPVLDASEE